MVNCTGFFLAHPSALPHLLRSISADHWARPRQLELLLRSSDMSLHPNFSGEAAPLNANGQRTHRAMLRLGTFALAIALSCMCNDSAAVPSSVLKLLQRTAQSSPARIGSLADETVALLQRGELEDAARRCEAIAAAERAKGTPESLQQAKLFDEAAESLRREHLTRVLKQAKADLDKMEHALDEGFLASLPPDLSNVIKSLGSKPVRLKPISLVRADVRRFVHAFLHGARDPELHFANIDPRLRPFLAKWRDTPFEKRLFLTGAGEDAAVARRLQAQADAQGYAVFFYDFCRDIIEILCADELVGAFFGSASHALLMDTALANASAYVVHEIGAIRHVRHGERMALLVSTEGVMAAPDNVVALAVVLQVEAETDEIGTP